MKGKFRILGHVGLALFVAVALMLAAMPAAKVEAATAVTDVWVDFPFTDSINATSATANHYYIHFTPATALSRGVDWVTVTFPDGSTAMGITAFSTISSVAKADLEFSTNYDTAAATWKVSTSDATCGGYRVKVKLPIDVAAGQDVWLRITSTNITSATVERSIYKVSVSTTKDTTPVLSSAFALGDSAVSALAVTPLVTTAGVGTQYIAAFTDTVNVGAGGTVTLKFPLGTTMPSSISTSYVLFSADGDNYSNATAATVDADLRTITGTTPLELVDANSKMKILSGAGLANPQRAAAASKCMIRTSTDAKWFVETATRAIVAGPATKIIVANGNIGTGTSRYSDDATMINMLSSMMFVTLADQYGNAKAAASAVTVSLSSSSGSGAFYTSDEADPEGTTPTYSSVTSLSVSTQSPATAAQQVFYKDTTAGTHTLTFSHASYTDATWTITIAPAISLYDVNDNLVNTYGAPSTVPVAEIVGDTTFTSQKYGVDYINSAITAAFAGDTVKLGDGIYELDAYINLNKQITLTSVNGAASTTIRPVTETNFIFGQCIAVVIGISGTAANPVIIDGLTFDRLRSGTEFDQAVFNNGWDYVSVTNNVFNYIIPELEADHEGGSVVLVMIMDYANMGGPATHVSVTSATISNNKFNNCCPFASPAGETAVITIMTKHGYAPASTSITGVTISGNEFTDCNGINININGSHGAGSVNTANECYITANVTDNTLTNPVIGIDIQRQTHGVNVLRNTVTGAYNAALYVETFDDGDPDDLVVKNNTFTGCAGADKTYFTSMSGAVVIEADAAEGAAAHAAADPVYQYNAIYDNDADYSIYVASDIGAQDCKYNWFGDATGPYYSALAGATVTKSNTDGAGKKVTDYVTYYPWLHKSVTDVVADNASYQASTMKLIVGWNTLSTPVKLISTANAIDELISADDMEIGYYYDAGWQLITTGYVLNACDAVYVKMDAATYVLLKFDASAFSTPSKDLAAGWNMMSLAYLSSAGKQADDAVASVKLTAAGLPGYSQVISPSLNATQTNMFGVAGTSWAYSSGETAGDTHTMYAGLGYWIYMQNAATLAGFEITPIAPDLD